MYVCAPNARALLHLRQLTLFGMITRLCGDRFNSHAIHVLKTAKYSCKSWFWQIRDICLLYGLPHPLLLLDNPPTKHTFKQLIKSKVIDHWEIKLRDEAGTLKSLSNFLFVSSLRSVTFVCTKYFFFQIPTYQMFIS